MSNYKNIKFKLVPFSQKDLINMQLNVNLHQQCYREFVEQFCVLCNIPFPGLSKDQIEQKRKQLNLSEDDEKDINYIKDLVKNKNNIGNSIYAFFTGTKKEMPSRKTDLTPLYRLLKANILPFSLLKGRENYKKSIFQTVINQTLEKFKSYFKCNESVENNFKLSLNKDSNEEQVLNESEMKDLQNLFENLSKNQSFSFFNFNKNWFSKDKIKTKLLNNETNKIKSLSSEEIDLILSYKDKLYSNEFDLISMFVEFNLQKQKAESLKSQADLNLFKNNNYSFRIGSNYENFNLTQNNKDILLEINSSMGEKITFKIIPHKKTQIWNLEKNNVKITSGENLGNYKSVDVIKMKRPADIKAKLLKTSELNIEIKNNQIYCNFIYEYKCSDHGVYFFHCSGNKKPDEKNENILKERERTFSFIDLGLFPMYSISTFKYNNKSNDGEILVKSGSGNEKLDFGSAFKIHSIQIGKNSTNLNKIKQLLEKLKDLKTYLKFSKSISSFDENSYQRQLKTGVEISELNSLSFQKISEIKSINLGFNESFNKEYFLKLIENQTFTQKELLLLNCKIKDLFKILYKEYSNIKNSRIFKFNKEDDLICDGYYWLQVIDEIINIKKSLTYFNSKPSEKGNKSKFIFLKDFNYKNNFANNYAKIAASRLKKYCLEHKVDVCVFEKNLNNFLQSKDNDKKTNKTLINWANRNLFEKIKLALEEHDICVSEVDGKHSSQLDPQTMNWGARDNLNGNGNKEKIFFERNGQIIQQNADLSASEVLAKRFFTRYEDIVHIYIDQKIKDDKTILKLVKGKVRVESYLKKTINSCYAIVDENGFLKPISKKDYNKFQELPSKPRTDIKSNEMYRHGSKWYHFQQHREFQQDLLARGRELKKIA